MGAIMSSILTDFQISFIASGKIVKLPTKATQHLPGHPAFSWVVPFWGNGVIMTLDYMYNRPLATLLFVVFYCFSPPPPIRIGYLAPPMKAAYWCKH